MSREAPPSHRTTHCLEPPSSLSLAYLLQTNVRSIDIMSSGRYTVTPTSNFKLITEALQDYAKQTGIDLAKHPSAERLELVDSPDAVLQIFQERENAFRKFRNRNRTLINCLRPAVQTLHIFSGVIGDAASLVSHTHLVPILVNLCRTQCDLARDSHRQKLSLLESMLCLLYVLLQTFFN